MDGWKGAARAEDVLPATLALNHNMEEEEEVTIQLIVIFLSRADSYHDLLYLNLGFDLDDASNMIIQPYIQKASDVAVLAFLAKKNGGKFVLKMA